MSLAPVPLFPAAAPAPCGGRPRAESDPEQVGKHLDAAKARLLFGARVKSLARYYDVDVRTVRRWITAALRYDGPEADRLRRMARDH